MPSTNGGLIPRRSSKPIIVAAGAYVLSDAIADNTMGNVLPIILGGSIAVSAVL